MLQAYVRWELELVRTNGIGGNVMFYGIDDHHAGVADQRMKTGVVARMMLIARVIQSGYTGWKLGAVMDKTHVYREFFYCSSRASPRALSEAPYIHNASAKWYLRFSGHSQKVNK